jgi:hypothetical protein
MLTRHTADVLKCNICNVLSAMVLPELPEAGAVERAPICLLVDGGIPLVSWLALWRQTGLSLRAAR